YRVVDRHRQLDAGRMLVADFIATGAMGTFGERCSLSSLLSRLHIESRTVWYAPRYLRIV
ncbi:MAG: hypothetical protein R6W94_04730, partial [Spirochaetia bacterium]